MVIICDKFSKWVKHMIRAALFISIALSLTSGTAVAADDARQPLTVPQNQSTNGVIMQLAVPPVTPDTASPTAITSLLWVYDTNTKQMMLCASHADTSFNCSRGVRLGWAGN